MVVMMVMVMMVMPWLLPPQPLWTWVPLETRVLCMAWSSRPHASLSGRVCAQQRQQLQQQQWVGEAAPHLAWPKVPMLGFVGVLTRTCAVTVLFSHGEVVGRG